MKKEIIIIENGVKITKEMTIEECIENFEGAIKKWGNECYMIMDKMSHNLMEYDDFYSEGMICLIEVYSKYKPINTFNTILHKSLDNLKIDLIRKTNAKKRKTEQSVVSFESEIEDEDVSLLHELEGDIDINYELVEFNEDMTNAMAKLTDEERKIFDFLIENESTKRVLAKQLNISRPTLDTRIERVRDKMIALLPEYLLY